jgi:hypothetical protein
VCIVSVSGRIRAYQVVSRCPRYALIRPDTVPIHADTKSAPLSSVSDCKIQRDDSKKGTEFVSVMYRRPYQVLYQRLCICLYLWCVSCCIALRISYCILAVVSLSVISVYRSHIVSYRLLAFGSPESEVARIARAYLQGVSFLYRHRIQTVSLFVSITDDTRRIQL